MFIMRRGFAIYQQLICQYYHISLLLQCASYALVTLSVTLSSANLVPRVLFLRLQLGRLGQSARGDIPLFITLLAQSRWLMTSMVERCAPPAPKPLFCILLLIYCVFIFQYFKLNYKMFKMLVSGR